MQSQLGAKHQSIRAAKPRPEFQSVNEYQSIGEAKPQPEYQSVRAAKPRPEFQSVGAAKPEFQSVSEYPIRLYRPPSTASLTELL